MKMRCVPLWLAVAALCHSAASIAAPAKHPATLDDAYAVGSVGHMASNPRDGRLAVESRGEILILSETDGGVRQRFAGSSPSWSPDGRRLAFLRSVDSEMQVFVWSVDEESQRQVTTIPGGMTPALRWPAGFCDWPTGVLSWSPDGTRVVLAARIPDPELFTHAAEQPKIRVYSEPGPVGLDIADGLFAAPTYWDTWHGNAKATALNNVAARDPKQDVNRLVVADVVSGRWAPITSQDRSYFCASWSPDGRHIAAIADLSNSYPINHYTSGQRVMASDIAIVDTTTNNVRTLGLPAYRVGAPKWSADSGSLALVTERQPRLYSFRDILVYQLKDQVAIPVKAPHGVDAKSVEWTRDGRSLLALMNTPFVDSLWRLNPVSGAASQVDAKGRQIEAFTELPDGTVAYSGQSGDFAGRLYAQRPNGKERLLYDANPQLKDVDLGKQLRITWRNRAGEPGEGIVILPPGYLPGKRYPVIVNVYPNLGRDRFWLDPSYELTGQLQASWGYIVFRPNLRTPMTAYAFPHGQEFAETARGAMGIPRLVDDFESGVARLVQLGYADPTRIGVFGHSYGGWTANLLVTHSQVPRAAIVTSGISNAITASFFPFPAETRGEDPATSGNVFDNLEDYVKLSPIFKMRDIDIPMLLTIGDDDWFYIAQIIPEYGVLKNEGKDVELVRYAGEQHSLRRRESIEDALARTRLFYDRTIGMGFFDGRPPSASN